MPGLTARNIRKLIAAALVGFILISLGIWYRTREVLPSRIRIASGVEGGLYDQFAKALKPRLEGELRRPVEIVRTRGAVENLRLLQRGSVELAMMQSGGESLGGVQAVAPVYDEVVHVMVRSRIGARSVSDLRGRRIAVGEMGSGTHNDAMRILAHYRVSPASASPKPATDLAVNPQLDAGFQTTGLLNPSLSRLLDTRKRDLQLLPIEDAEALSVRFPFYEAKTIPRGLYAESPPVPPRPILTVAAKAFLAVHEEAPSVLVTAALRSLYETGLRNSFPVLLPLEEARDWAAVPRHSASSSYFEPYAGIGVIANFLESISAVKELLFALGAGLYLLWDRMRRIREREREALIRAQRERLDGFLVETMRVERDQMDMVDPVCLDAALDEVTSIKLRALQELTDERLRDTQAFAVFMAQCASLSEKIQMKRALCTPDAALVQSRSGRGSDKDKTAAARDA